MNFCSAMFPTYILQKLSNQIFDTHLPIYQYIFFQPISKWVYTYTTLEIKPCGLGSRVWDMEAETYNWSHLLIGEHLGYFLFLFVSRTGTALWDQPNIELKCQNVYIEFQNSAKIQQKHQNSLKLINS